MKGEWTLKGCRVERWIPEHLLKTVFRFGPKGFAIFFFFTRGLFRVGRPKLRVAHSCLAR